MHQSFSWLRDPRVMLSIPLVLLIAAGLVTMASFGLENTHIVNKQIIFAIIGLVLFFIVSSFNIANIQKSWLILLLYGVGCALLVGLFFAGSTIKGATSWYSFGSFSFQPVDVMKIALILLLAKYLSKRHVEIARVKHLVITGFYTLIPFALVVIQPDFGSAMVIGAIWFGTLLLSGLSRKHLLIMTCIACLTGVIFWNFVFAPYQKDRIETFLHPTADTLGSGYNSYQSMVAVGSGRILGKGVGYGSQARLQFLPENQTDFIFASFAEEWGFLGSLLIIALFGLLLAFMVSIAISAISAFDMIIVLGIIIMLTTHIVINIGMNLGILPVTGLTLPFMSYGGSHLIIECIAVGIVASIGRFRTRVHHSTEIHNEFLGYAKPLRP